MAERELPGTAVEALAVALRRCFEKASSSGGDKAITVLAAAYDVESPNDKIAVMRRHARVHALFPAIEDELDALPFESSGLRRWIPAAEQNLFQLNFDAQAKDAFKWLNARLVEDADQLAAITAHHLPRQVDANRLHSLLADIDELVERVSELDDNLLRTFLLRHLRDIRRAIEDAWLLGVQVVDEQVAQTLGAVGAHSPKLGGILRHPLVVNLIAIAMHAAVDVGMFHYQYHALEELVAATVLEAVEKPEQRLVLRPNDEVAVLRSTLDQADAGGPRDVPTIDIDASEANDDVGGP